MDRRARGHGRHGRRGEGLEGASSARWQRRRTEACRMRPDVGRGRTVRVGVGARRWRPGRCPRGLPARDGPRGRRMRGHRRRGEVFLCGRACPWRSADVRRKLRRNLIIQRRNFRAAPANGAMDDELARAMDLESADVVQPVVLQELGDPGIPQGRLAEIEAKPRAEEALHIRDGNHPGLRGARVPQDRGDALPHVLPCRNRKCQRLRLL
mmetsp:Transcript_75542/g.211752  ORF Transcript_75542/g.211752 Transcript_75542/m.211752 type:complete len:210 (+) Transcript_75542:791-1420(+)